MTRTLRSAKTEAKRLLTRYQQVDPSVRTPMLRSLAEVFVDAREHFLRPDGSPDWHGRTYAYRQFVREAFSEAGLDDGDRASIQAAIRYHVSAVLRDRLDEETLADYGLQPETARQRSHERRSNRTALLNALTARDLHGGALLAVSAAYTVLSRFEPRDLDSLDEREAEVAEASLADLEARVQMLRARLAKRKALA